MSAQFEMMRVPDCPSRGVWRISGWPAEGDAHIFVGLLVYMSVPRAMWNLFGVFGGNIL